MRKNQVKVAPPLCCGQSMNINARVNRVSGKRIVYICRNCGHTKTERV